MGVPDGLRDALADRYALERELGRGGMAVVYLAQDLRHDRPVALKVLLPELAATLGPERFQREIKLAARLQHPHILTVYDSGDAAGRLWFTMPFVEGESLRDRLRRERQLPVDDALRIAREAAVALDYAHRHGVVHRDIKPENILLTADGDTLVADFGIARGLGGEDGLTQTGFVVGTPAYMSPEQAAGDNALDARTDIYSLASVLYEMLAGEPPYTGPTVQAMTAERLTGPVPSVRLGRPSVPASVDLATRRALAPIPADRFASAAQFAQALELPSEGTAAATTKVVVETPAVRQAGAEGHAARVGTPSRRHRLPFAAAALVTGLLIGIGIFFAWRRAGTRAPDTAAGSRVLAVLPFENLGPSEDDYFADGVTDAVRGKLAALPSVQVIARSSSVTYKKAAKSPQQIAHELGVRYLLTGTVRWQKEPGGASRVQVSPELVEVSPTGAPRTRWQEPFDAALTDVFQVQADVATRVAQALGATLGSDDREALEARPTRSLAAWDAFLKGEEVSDGLAILEPPALRRALGYYEQAVALDSTFAIAWAKISEAHSLLYFISEPRPEELEAALAAAHLVAALAPRSPEAHVAMARYYEDKQDFQRALDQYAQGLRLAPNNAELLAAQAFLEEQLGRFDAAEEHYRRAQTLDPASVQTTRRLARVLTWRRRYPEAVAMADHAVALAPGNLVVVETKAIVSLALGDLAGARSTLRAVPHEVKPASLAAFFANYDDMYWVLDQEQQALVLRLTPRQFDDNRAAWALALARLHALRGDQTRARVYADSARTSYEEQLRSTPNDPLLHALHGLVLAMIGRKDEAIREGLKGVELSPISKDAFTGPFIQQQLVRIYFLSGEPEKALDRLEPLIRIPYRLSAGWLRIDPTFDPLRSNPRFRKLVGGTA